MKTSIGLKKLEKIFEIYREGEVISGSNLAKTFHKVLKDKEYIERMPKEKVNTILVYNEQDVVNLFNIFVNWKKYIGTDDNVEEIDSDENIEKNNDNEIELNEKVETENKKLEESEQEIFTIE